MNKDSSVSGIRTYFLVLFTALAFLTKTSRVFWDIQRPLGSTYYSQGLPYFVPPAMPHVCK